VPLLALLALFIVGCDSSCQAIRSRRRGSALARLRRVALGRAASNELGTSEDGKRKHCTLRWATFLAWSSQTSSKRRLLRAILEAHHAAVRSQLQRHRGREVKTTGDGVLAPFDGPARAQEIVRAVRPLDIEVRAGIRNLRPNQSSTSSYWDTEHISWELVPKPESVHP
jgi:class 3 adenylate cyclase